MRTVRVGKNALRGMILLAWVLIFSGAFVCGAQSSEGGKTASVREYEKTYRTYPYSAPNPVPALTNFYPYFRFDGFTATARDQQWKVVELANDYLSLEILPEIGGKIWTATDKATGKSFFYSNPVVKFRDVGMRGPWTSGGLEFNVGIIGHTPNCSSPVDYFTRTNSDGSVSCFIGGLDLVARADWTVEIRLPADAAIFSTRVFWNNGSGVSQPYYTWMNLGIRAGEQMRAINPGTAFLGHDGIPSDWPIDPATGKDLALYRNNDFGSYKSYHVIGRLAEFFGAYYEDEDFGIASIAPSEAKRGRKIWIWGLSREGMIWEDLLTDPPGGQYVEIQTGRLFNQGQTSSAETPFKQRSFSPYSTDAWTEYWMPVRGIGGFCAASPDGALNVTSDAASVAVGVFAARPIQSELVLFCDGKKIAAEPVTLAPGETLEKRFALPAENANDTNDTNGGKKLTVSLGSLRWSNDDSDRLSRPLKSDNAKSADRLSDHWQAARERARDKKYDSSDAEYRKCLEKDSGFVPAYVGLSENAERRGEDAKSAEEARKALELDAYDGGANYHFGRASLRLGNLADAQEAFSVAALDPAFRSPALIGLGQTHFVAGRTERALAAFDDALLYNAKSPDALFGKLLALRHLQRTEEHAALADALLEANPLAHYARLEKMFAGRASEDEVRALIRTELPHEVFLERAIRYAAWGDRESAERTLQLGLGMPEAQRAEMLFHRAFYAEDAALLAEAEKEPVDFCFPFRPESLEVFRWAAEHGSSWKSRYLLAVLLAATGHKKEAREQLNALADEPDSAVFYAFRGTLCEKNRLADYEKAVTLDNTRLKFATLYMDELEHSDDSQAFLAAAEKYHEKFPEDTRLASLYARALIRNGRRGDALAFLEKTVFLPNEGSTSARSLYHETALEEALASFEADDFHAALAFLAKARSWPENLGAGQPYPNLRDERREDLLEALCYARLGETESAKKAAERVIAQSAEGQIKPSCQSASGPLFCALAYRYLGDAAAGEKILRDRLAAEASESNRDALKLYLNPEPASKPTDLTSRIIAEGLSLPPLPSR